MACLRQQGLSDAVIHVQITPEHRSAGRGQQDLGLGATCPTSPVSANGGGWVPIGSVKNLSRFRFSGGAGPSFRQLRKRLLGPSHSAACVNC